MTIHEEFFGQTRNAPRPHVDPLRDDKFIPASLAFFCPGCGDVWARFMIDDGLGTLWTSHNRPCAKCGIGSVWQDAPFFAPLMAAMPLKVVAREFLLAMDEPSLYFRNHLLRRHVGLS